MTGDWNKRPKGCAWTITGMHIPKEKITNYGFIEIYCSACGKIDDSGKFIDWLGYKTQEKVDDRKPLI